MVAPSRVRVTAARSGSVGLLQVSVIEVLVDEVDEEGTIARSKGDAPEIDGLVYIDGHFDAQPGDFLRVKVIDADHHDLYAEVV